MNHIEKLLEDVLEHSDHIVCDGNQAPGLLSMKSQDVLGYTDIIITRGSLEDGNVLMELKRSVSSAHQYQGKMICLAAAMLFLTMSPPLVSVCVSQWPSHNHRIAVIMRLYQQVSLHSGWKSIWPLHLSCLRLC